jgi:hypothetical protein
MCETTSFVLLVLGSLTIDSGAAQAAARVAVQAIPAPLKP